MPGIIEWPAGIVSHRETNVPAVTMDILPTIMDLLGVNSTHPSYVRPTVNHNFVCSVTPPPPTTTQSLASGSNSSSNDNHSTTHTSHSTILLLLDGPSMAYPSFPFSQPTQNLYHRHGLNRLDFGGVSASHVSTRSMILVTRPRFFTNHLVISLVVVGCMGRMTVCAFLCMWVCMNRLSVRRAESPHDTPFVSSNAVTDSHRLTNSLSHVLRCFVV